MHSILAITEFKIPNSGLMNCIGLLLQKKNSTLKTITQFTTRAKRECH